MIIYPLIGISRSQVQGVVSNFWVGSATRGHWKMLKAASNRLKRGGIQREGEPAMDVILWLILAERVDYAPYTLRETPIDES